MEVACYLGRSPPAQAPRGGPCCMPGVGRHVPWAELVGPVLEPDLILLTGDYVLGHLLDLQESVRHLSRLRARRGIFAVLGDKDLQPGTQKPHYGIPEALRDAKVELLRNEGRTLPGGLRLVG